MKRYGNLYNKICSIENLKLADKKARRGKKNRPDILKFDENKEDNLINLHFILKRGEFKTSDYYIFKIYDYKEREIYRLPYYPDRIVHHALMNILEPIFVSSFISSTYNCIKGRGIHKALYDVRRGLKNPSCTKYCLKFDILKFYKNINSKILKKLLSKKFKDRRLLELLYEIIDSTQGIPIGNYLSQYFANFYLTYFDHWIKEELKVKCYYRYCDDVVILGKTKKYLWKIFSKVREYLVDKLRLTIKNNYQVFPVESRGIDFVGYRIYHTHVLLRKRIKKNFIGMMKNNRNNKSIASYKGWLQHGNCVNLTRKYLGDE